MRKIIKNLCIVADHVPQASRLRFTLISCAPKVTLIYKQKSVQHEWAEHDPALQFLLLPRTNMPSLPQYQAGPAYLDPFHCRLCLQIVSRDALLSHLRSAHQISSVQEYRHEVFARTLAEWPQQIPAQILSTRLAAFTSELSEHNFKELPCASCARQKRMGKLRAVQFPPPSATHPPA